MKNGEEKEYQEENISSRKSPVHFQKKQIRLTVENSPPITNVVPQIIPLAHIFFFLHCDI
jgi:hypothetical protein